MSLMNERISITIASGSLSTCSSLLIAIMIPRSHGGLSTPYRRIIFGLSISDIIQSISLMLGPFLVPSNDNLSGSSWAIGNFYTCQFQGFAFTFGAATTCMYSLFLCLYYHCKLKRNMSDVTFSKKIERKVHCLIVLFNFAACVIALATKTFNSLPRSASCQFTKKPYGCDPSVPGSCERGHLANIFSLLYFPVAVPCICLFGMLFFMFSIVVHVYKRDRLFRSGRRRGNGNEEQETEADHVARLLRREVTLQVVLYVLAFLMTYGWIVLVTFLVRVNISTPLFVVVIVAVFFPLMGLFNILIYTRPQVVAYRRLHRDTSCLVAFWRVLKAGGENPDAATSSAEYSRQSSKCCKGFFCPRKKKRNQKQKVPSGLLRLRALCESIESPPIGALNQNHQGMIEPCSPGTNSMDHRISTITDHVEDQTEEGWKDAYSSQSPDSKNYQAQYLNVLEGLNLLSTQKDAISKAFEKATQRAMALNEVNFCLPNTNACSKQSENHINSEWSHGVSVGSFAGSLSGMEHEHDESLRLDDKTLESQ